ncbi:transposase family protein [Streptomyces mirabilis]|uniref:transposase family protein n=1 Tax=Streptomyces mirabilis TaxID=68239 RepID=UPI003F621785
MIEEVAGPWAAQRESALHERRGHDRQRAAGAGPNHQLVFVDRVLITLVYLRLQLPHAALAELYGVTRPTVTRAIHEIRPLPARRGFAVPQRLGARLHTLTGVFAHAEAEGSRPARRRNRSASPPSPGRTSRPQGVRVRQEEAEHRQKKQSTAKTTTISDSSGRLLWSGTDRPGPMRDQTAVRAEGIAERFRLHPKVKAEADEGYRGLANEFPDRVSAPPKKPKDDASLGGRHAWRKQRRRQSSRRICVEHVIGEVKKWRPLQRHTRRREYYPETHAAIAGLVCDRAARRPTRPRTSTELVLVHRTAC